MTSTPGNVGYRDPRSQSHLECRWLRQPYSDSPALITTPIEAHLNRYGRITPQTPIAVCRWIYPSLQLAIEILSSLLLAALDIIFSSSSSLRYLLFFDRNFASNTLFHDLVSLPPPLFSQNGPVKIKPGFFLEKLLPFPVCFPPFFLRVGWRQRHTLPLQY